MKLLRNKALIFIVIIEILLLPVISCSKGDSGSTEKEKVPTGAAEEITIAEQDQQIRESEILTPVEQPEAREGLITYYSGDVSVFEEGEWYEVEIGDFVTEKNIIKVNSDSFCEVQFGETAVIKIQENSEIDLARISLEPGNAEVALDMKIGNVICKVQKLTGNESFKVKTQTAVCGVRGTEFSVASNADEETVLAVKKGAVAVMPKSVDVDQLKEKVAGKGEAIADAIQKIEDSAPVVQANEELTVDKKIMEETQTAADKIEKVIDDIAASETPETEEVYLEKINRIVEEQKNEVVKTVEKPREMSAENNNNLKQVEHMKMIAITPVAVKTDGSSAPAEPAILLHKVSINSLTENAVIEKDGRMVGIDSFSGIFEDGETIRFHISKEGYQPYDMEFKVTKNTARLYRVELDKLPEPEKVTPKKMISINAVPDTAEIYIDGALKGNGSFSSEFEVGTKLIVRAENRGYSEKSFDLLVSEDSEESYTLTLEKGVKTLTVSAVPADSEIIYKGKTVGKGKATLSFKYGEAPSISFKRSGYKDKALSLKIDDTTKAAYTVTLDNKPVDNVLSPFSAKVINSVSYGNGRLFAADSEGNIFSSKIDGTGVWKYSSGNKPNANSAPVPAGKFIFFSGAKEMLVLESETGKLYSSTRLDQNSAHMFGRRIIPFEGSFIYPKNNSLTISSFQKGEKEGQIPLPVDSGMTPAAWGKMVVIADQEGTVNIINYEVRSIIGTIKTSAIQPIALGMTVTGNTGYFANRKGKVVAVDLENRTLKWEKEIQEEKINIFTDLTVENGRIYVYTGQKIHILSAADGEILGEPIPSVSPPFCRINNFYFGKPDGSFAVYRCTTGKEVKSIPLNYGKITTRPVFAGDRIIAGTDSGKIIIFNPEGFGL